MNRGSMAFFFGMLFCFTSLSGQNTQDTILAYFNLLEKVPQEKLYLHLDKPFYGAGEKIWFKGYLVNSVTHQDNTQSNFIITELVNRSDSIVERKKIRRDSLGFHNAFTLRPTLPTHAEQTLKEILNYMVASKKQCYLAIDEFQQITEYPEKGVEALLRSHIQFMPNVHFIFSGSKKHVMEEMFTSAKRPFYQSTQIIVLTEIPLENYYSFAHSFFAKEKRELTLETFSYLYQLENGHTWYVQSILNRLYEKKINPIDNRLVDRCINDILDEQETIYQSNLTLLTNNQVDLLKAIATEGCIKSINANDFIKKHHLKTPSSVNVALKSLLNKELIYNTPDGYIVYDRFFGKWLKDAVI